MQFSHTPRKRFGQHFLQDRNIIQKIIAALQLKHHDTVVEIGPGLGALTTQLLPLLDHLDVIELDRNVIPILMENCKNSGKLIIHQGDALQFDFSQLSEKKNSLRIIGNLPYNISTPLLFHLLNFSEVIEDMHFMLQKEVVERIVAQPGSGDYGRLSVMLQYHCQAEFLFVVKPSCFTPPPKVDSAIIKIIPFREIPFRANNEKLFADIVREAFNHRRKTLRNCLRSYLTPEQFEALEINPMQRPEEISVADYVKMANYIFLIAPLSA
jgi:16S rRNA (adenine1518-N6/adenine1519-N6)-dimethyltransferase